MSKTTLDEAFKKLEGQFDLENPSAGHQQRFLDKLNNQNKGSQNRKKVFRLWRPLAGIAASLALIISVLTGVQNSNSTKELASISPEMASTQEFFTTAIANELVKLNSEENPEYQDLIVDTMFQIKILEGDYELLKTDLRESGDDQRVIYAMIANFQSRIDLLQNVVEQIDNLKQDKLEDNENSSTL